MMNSIVLAGETMGTALFLPSGTTRSVKPVVELLQAALESMTSSREQAANYVVKACSVLEASFGASAASKTVGDYSYVRGGLLPWQAKRVGEFVEANISKPLSAEQLAAEVRLGPSYFQRAFKKSFGVSPHAFVIQRRVARAQHLMLSTDQSLCQIALAAGFSDQAHFTTRFLRATRTTPGLWRRERKNNLDFSGDIRNAA